MKFRGGLTYPCHGTGKNAQGNVCGVFADRKDFHFIPTRGKLINEVYQFVQGSHSAIPKKTDCTWKKKHWPTRKKQKCKFAKQHINTNI